MNILDNWLLQAIIGNVVCFVLGKIAVYFFNSIKSNNAKTSKKLLSNYSKKILRQQFYISLVFNLISIIGLFFFIGKNFLTVLCTTVIFWSTLFMIFAFECSLECFKDSPRNRRKNNA